MNGPVDDVVLHRDPVRPEHPDARGVGVMETARVHVRGPAGDDGARVHPRQREPGVVGFGEALLTALVELHVGEPAPTW